MLHWLLTGTTISRGSLNLGHDNWNTEAGYFTVEQSQHLTRAFLQKSKKFGEYLKKQVHIRNDRV